MVLFRSEAGGRYNEAYLARFLITVNAVTEFLVPVVPTYAPHSLRHPRTNTISIPKAQLLEIHIPRALNHRRLL